MKKQKNDNEKQIGVYLFQVVSIFVLFFCVWLLTREKTYNEIDVNKVAQNLVELMPDTVVSENDMVVKERFGLEANAFNALVYYGPDSNMDAAELLQNKDALGLLLANGNWSQTQRARVNLSLPKFDVSSDLDILDTLAQLGITDVMDGTKSDFTPLTTASDSLELTQAKHAARVKIDEDGCEAAAYTILGVEATAMMGPEDEIDFTLDKPFVFAITGIDGLPLFVGLVNQPG